MDARPTQQPPPPPGYYFNYPPPPGWTPPYADAAPSDAAADASASDAAAAAGAGIPPSPWAPPGPYQYAAQYGYGAPNSALAAAPPKPAPGTPTWVLVAAGAAVGAGALKVFDFVKGGPAGMQEKMMKAAMEAAMKSAAKGGAGGGKPGMPPGFGGFPGAGAGGFGAPAAPGAGAGSKGVVDVKPVATTASTWDKTAKRKGGDEAGGSKSAPDGSSTSAPAADAAESTSASASAGKKPSAFARAKGASSSSSASPSPPPTSSPADAAASAGEAAGDGAVSPQRRAAKAMLDAMLSDPKAQEMLYPYLPEGMRDPTVFKAMLETPGTRDQIEGMLEAQAAAQMAGGGGGDDAAFGLDPELAASLADFDPSGPEAQAQFDALGVKPEEMMAKVMGDPELMKGFANPKVQRALVDLQKDPMKMFEHMGDPEVGPVLRRMQEVFAPEAMKAAAAQKAGDGA